MKALVVGLGSAGQRHARNLRQLTNGRAQLLTCRSRGWDLVIDAQLNATFGRRPEEAYGITNFPSLDLALAERPDVVVVANPISMHVPVARQAVEAGAHVFVEKPLSDVWDGVEDLIAAARSRRLVGCVAYQMRFHPGLQRVKALIERGAIGRVVSAAFHFGEYLPGMHPYEDYREGHAARRDQGGGVVRALSHEIDTARWLFGEPRRVYAGGGHLSSLEIDVEDVAMIQLECERDGRRLPVMVYLDFVQRPTRRYCEIVGDEGTLRWDYHQQLVARYDPAAGEWEEEITPLDRNQMFLDEMRDFLDAAAAGRPPAVTLEDGAGTLRVALAALESMESGQAREVTT